jgi:hypothetical protein
MLETISIILSIIVAAFVVRGDVGRLWVGLFRREKTDAEIAGHVRTEDSQKNAIEALKTRMEVLESSNADLLTKYGLMTYRYEQLLTKSAADGDKTARLRRVIHALLDRLAALEDLLTAAGIVHALDPIEIDPADLSDGKGH